MPAAVPQAARTLASELEVTELVAHLLVRRGFKSADDARAFLSPSAAAIHKPDLLPDIAPATQRLSAAVRARERVLVCGDYDVDGVTGTALLVLALGRLGCNVDYYLPRRDVDGYGFSHAGVEHARSIGASLIVTTDCGSADAGTVDAARASGIDVIITDHHELSAGAPPLAAVAFVNPKRPDSAYPFRELAGVGVAFKLIWSLLASLGRPREELTSLVDLVGLGTLADVVPLVGENRVIARLALGMMGSAPRPGIKALLMRAGVRAQGLTSHHAGFILGPRINAAGRIGHAARAVRLLLTEDPYEAAEISAELDKLNRSRQAIEATTLKEALATIEADGLASGRTLVVAGEDWHEGVIGIVAGRLAERYWRPTAVVALRGDHGKGSARSVSGFNIHAALADCSSHLLGYGGHRYAAGLTVERAQLPALRAALNDHAAAYPPEVFEPNLHIEAFVTPESIGAELLAEIERLEPFGPDNPVPLLASIGVEIIGYPRRIGRNHLALRVRTGTGSVEAVAWDRSHDIPNLNVGSGGSIDICYRIDRHGRGGHSGIRLNVVDLRSTEDGA